MNGGSCAVGGAIVKGKVESSRNYILVADSV
jgi:hypothetical protein